MKIIVKETNYKIVEVPDDTTLCDIERMIQSCEVIIGDTTDTEYSVKFPDKEWEALL